LADAGHDVDSVVGEGLVGAADTLIRHLKDRSPVGELWVVRLRLVRVYGGEPG
jgi:hypothetical protein